MKSKNLHMSGHNFTAEEGHWDTRISRQTKQQGKEYRKRYIDFEMEVIIGSFEGPLPKKRNVMTEKRIS